MPRHDIALTLPTKPIKNADTTIVIKSGTKTVGTMLISRGSLDWYPANAQKARRVTWENFGYLMDNASRAVRLLRSDNARRARS